MIVLWGSQVVESRKYARTKERPALPEDRKRGQNKGTQPAPGEAWERGR